MPNKTILITGATSGIGLATANIFAENNWNIIITGRRENLLQEVKNNIKTKYNIDVEYLCFDITNKAELIENLALIKEKNVDVLVNNAGLALGLEPIDEGSFDDWDIMIDTNIKGLLYISKIIATKMKKNGSGHIINLSSSAGKEVYPNGGVYCATKHAVDAITKAMRMDLFKYGIKVSAVSPGMVETSFSEVRFKGDTHRAKKVYEGIDVLKANDIAETIYFIATRPKHVNIQDVLMFSSDQASATLVNRK
jgi:3-hydroxy acid dehydrogenase/malonic semialdehyde reductase